MIMLDTHIAVALYAGKVTGLSAAAARAVDREPACISPAVLLEMELLHEIGRLRQGGAPIAAYLEQQLGITLANDRFAEIARQALTMSFTRDPFDRLIVAHAQMRDARLITLDGQIAQHYGRALA